MSGSPSGGRLGRAGVRRAGTGAWSAGCRRGAGGCLGPRTSRVLLVAGSSDLSTSKATTPMHAPTTTTNSANVDTPNTSVTPPGHDDDTSHRRTRRLWVALAINGSLLAAAVTWLSMTTVPYFAFSPGNAIETDTLIDVEEGATTYESDGEILFLTARVGRVSALEAFAGWVDGDVDLVAEQAVLQGATDEENRAAQAAAMVGSKNTAVVVAFGRLGLALDPTGTGAVVLGLTVGSPAEAILEVADVIVAVDGMPIELDAELSEAIGGHAPGDSVTLDVEGLDGDVRQESVTLAARPDDPARGFLGVASDTRAFDPRPAFAVDIDEGAVGGPSAGLAFSLAIIDVLSEGDLTGGLRVAVTGSIEPDGTVTPVGGVAQKIVAAAGAGADVLIVPAGEEAEAKRNPHGLEVIGVADLDEALAALERLGGDPLPSQA